MLCRSTSATVGIMLNAVVVSSLHISALVSMAAQFPVLPLGSLMACRVFRGVLLRLENVEVDADTMLLTTIVGHDPAEYKLKRQSNPEAHALV